MVPTNGHVEAGKSHMGVGSGGPKVTLEEYMKLTTNYRPSAGNKSRIESQHIDKTHFYMKFYLLWFRIKSQAIAINS
jgi:hypothetical protein